MTEIKFKSDTSFRKQWFTGISFSHPAKMILPLQIWLIDRYTQPGETILDPMAGSGTILVACSMGRNVVCIDLEQKFVDMMKGNWEKVKQRGPQLGYQMGEATILQGDARNLEGLLSDSCIFSPPYGNRLSDDEVNDNDPQRMSYRQALGKVDSIITSPPYAETGASGKSRTPFWERLASDPTSARYNRNRHPSVGEEYSDSKNNLGNLSYGDIDAVITSPPYEGSLESGSRHTAGGIPERDIKLGSTGLYASENSDNIGNLKSDSYLQAMLQVYCQCRRVLKPKGLLILVTKDFIREKKRIDLAGDTMKLCEQAGFTFIERHYRRLTSQSFWRIIYKQKFPDAPEINSEDILVFKK